MITVCILDLSGKRPEGMEIFEEISGIDRVLNASVGELALLMDDGSLIRISGHSLSLCLEQPEDVYLERTRKPNMDKIRMSRLIDTVGIALEELADEITMNIEKRLEE